MSEAVHKLTRILVVDDDEGVLEVLVEATQAMGYESIGTTDGRKAVEMLKDGDFDLVMSDKNMPRYSGFQFLSDCHKAGILKPFIFLSGEDSLESMLAGVRLGAVDFVLKPIDFVELERVLKRVSAFAALKKYEETILETFAKKNDPNIDIIRKALREQLNLLRTL